MGGGSLPLASATSRYLNAPASCCIYSALSCLPLPPLRAQSPPATPAFSSSAVVEPFHKLRIPPVETTCGISTNLILLSVFHSLFYCRSKISNCINTFVFSLKALEVILVVDELYKLVKKERSIQRA